MAIWPCSLAGASKDPSSFHRDRPPLRTSPALAVRPEHSEGGVGLLGNCQICELCPKARREVLGTRGCKVLPVFEGAQAEGSPLPAPPSRQWPSLGDGAAATVSSRRRGLRPAPTLGGGGGEGRVALTEDPGAGASSRGSSSSSRISAGPAGEAGIGAGGAGTRRRPTHPSPALPASSRASRDVAAHPSPARAHR